jgi:23S rRNA (adenine2503-C2)-methyltransferase
MLLLKDITVDTLSTELTALGLSIREARHLHGHSMRACHTDIPSEPPSGIARWKWNLIRERVALPSLEIVDQRVSAVDGFAKYLFRGAGPELFEAVRIPLLHRPGDEKYIVCVSSQVGCAQACAFCATGRLGFKRNLETWEIVDQVVQIKRAADFPVRGVVFMGMGEPTLNYARVMRAARIMTDPSGMAIDGKSISISTVGVAPAIRKFADSASSFRLFVSLTSAIPERRERLLPVTRNYPLPVLFDALRYYYGKRKKRIPLAWTMLSGVNLGRDETKALAQLIGDLPVMIDLIPVNDATGEFRPPEKPELDDFIAYLKEDVRQPIVCRYSGGKDIHGACGMLAGGSQDTH